MRLSLILLKGFLFSICKVHATPTEKEGLISIPVKAISKSETADVANSLDNDSDSLLNSLENFVSVPGSSSQFEVFMTFDLDPQTLTVLVNGNPAQIGEQQMQVPVSTSVHTHELLVDVLVTVTDLGQGAYLVQEEVLGMTEIDMTVTQLYPISQKISLADDESGAIIRGSPCHHPDPHLEGEDELFNDIDYDSNQSTVIPTLKESTVHFVDADGNFVGEDKVESSSRKFYYYLAQILDFAIFLCLVILFFNLISYVFSIFFKTGEADDEKETESNGYKSVSIFSAPENTAEKDQKLFGPIADGAVSTSEDLPAYSG